MSTPLVCPKCGNGAQLTALEQVVAHYPADYVDDGSGQRWPTYKGAPTVPTTSIPVSTGVVRCAGCGHQCIARDLVRRPNNDR